jgi:uncharacterized protein (DUF1778 family)
MAKTNPLGVRLEPEEMVALVQAAASEDRSLSAFARRIIADWLRTKGWLDRGKK